MDTADVSNCVWTDTPRSSMKSPSETTLTAEKRKFPPNERTLLQSLPLALPLLAHLPSPAILDPCAGNGTLLRALAHATGGCGVYAGVQCSWTKRPKTWWCEDVPFLAWDARGMEWDLIASCPPYNHALAIVLKSLDMLADGGILLMLMRLNFLASRKRWMMLHSVCPPTDVFLLPVRPKFQNGTTDSTEMAWFRWQKGIPSTETILRWHNTTTSN